MAAEPHDLLGDGAAVGHDRHLHQKPGLVHLGVAQQLDHRGAQTLAVFVHRLGVSGLDLAGHALDGVHLLGKIPLHGLALAAAHGHQLIKGRVQRREHQPGHRVPILFGLGHHQHVGHPGDGHQAAVVLQFPAGQLAQGAAVGVKQRMIRRDGLGVHAQVAIGHEHVHMAPVQPGGNRLAGRVLQKHQVPWHAKGQVQKAVIDALELNRHLSPVDFAVAAAVSRHAQHGTVLQGCSFSDHIIAHSGPLAYAISEN